MSCRALNRRLLVHFALTLAALSAGLLPLPALAAVTSATAPAAPSLLFAAPVAHPAIPGQAGGVVRVTLALILVLAAVFAAAWFSRRMHGVGSARHSALEVIAQLPLGPRERAILVRVGGQRVLLGVASGNVRALHVLPGDVASTLSADEAASTGIDGAAALAASSQRPTFKSMLLKSLGK